MHNVIDVTNNILTVRGRMQMDFFMQFSGYQRICCLFAIGLFTVDCRDVIGGTGFYKGTAMVN